MCLLRSGRIYRISSSLTFIWSSFQAVSGPDHVTIKFTESNLQTFPPSSESQGKISANVRPPSDANDSFSKPARGNSDEPQPTGWMHAFTVGAYKPYFDVDTSDVLERIRDSLFSFRGTFTEKTSDNPDL
ncbi:hypothetical protein Cni_G24155 [Canna indica]|uniref:Uncharacterized protein n=1 Tax=Canna indica TaxID=4628 RepID=A0AAQ3QL72_9LILI|nr:hypothetical protein Cni_G24155 [Canna indica]